MQLHFVTFRFEWPSSGNNAKYNEQLVTKMNTTVPDDRKCTSVGTSRFIGLQY